MTLPAGMLSTSASTSSTYSCGVTRATIWDLGVVRSAHPSRMGPVREVVTGARRIVVKVGSSSLTTAEGGIDDQRVDALVDALGGLTAQGREVVLVSSGAIAAGLSPLHLRRRPRDLATQQAAA